MFETLIQQALNWEAGAVWVSGEFMLLFQQHDIRGEHKALVGSHFYA